MTDATGEVIHRFAAAHLDVAAELYVAVFNAPPWNDRWTPAIARARLADALATPGVLGFVLISDGLLSFVLGYRERWYDGEHYYLSELCVRADRQRSGLGGRLLLHLERELSDQGVGRSYLITEREGPAASFYAKHGYYASARMVMMAHRLDGGRSEGDRRRRDRNLLSAPPVSPRLLHAGVADVAARCEMEVLQLIADGLPNKTIAMQLGISEHTAKFHVSSLLAKLGAFSRTEAVSTAARRGLLVL